MVKKVLSIFVSICMFVGGLTVVGCSDKDYYDEDRDPDFVAEKPSTLDFSTSQTVRLNLNYDMSGMTNNGSGFASVFELYTEYPLDKNGALREDLSPIAAGIHVVGQSDLKRVIPAYVDELYMYSQSLFVPTLSYAKIEGGNASFEAMDVEIAENSTRAGNAGSFGTKPISKHLKEKSDFYEATENGNFMYDLIAPDDYRALPTEIANAMSTAFPEGKIVDQKYYKDASIKITKAGEGQKGAEVFLSVVFGGGSYNNSLSYFVYQGPKDLTELTEAEVQELEVINIFQYADVYTNSQTAKKNIKGLTPGKYVQLLYKDTDGEYVKEFPVGAQIGWILHPNSFDATSFTVSSASLTAYNRRLFSVSDWNDAQNTTSIPGLKTNNYNIFFSAEDNTGYVYNCFGFEDKPSESDGDCNDVIFHILTNPVDALDPPPSITDEDIETTEHKKGILAFEDNWPNKGDYDLNDAVVKYSSEITYLQKLQKENGVVVGRSDVMVKQVKDVFSFIHAGATFNNAFSYKIDVPSSAVDRIIIIDGDNNATDYTNQIIVDGNGFIIDLCKNVSDIIIPMERSPQSYNYTVTIDFKEGTVLQDGFAELAAPYNPFIIPRGEVAVEVHLPMYPPTQRADRSLFGTQDDRSDQNTLWYVSGENVKFPFAIHLADADEFNLPEETFDISTTYPRFIDWVNSGMTTNKDWYK